MSPPIMFTHGSNAEAEKFQICVLLAIIRAPPQKALLGNIGEFGETSAMIYIQS